MEDEKHEVDDDDIAAGLTELTRGSAAGPHTSTYVRTYVLAFWILACLTEH